VKEYFSYVPGDTTVVARWPICVFTTLPADDERVDEIFDALMDEASIDSALDVLACHGLSRMPSFGILDIERDETRFIVRGAIQGYAQGCDPIVGTRFFSDTTIPAAVPAKLAFVDGDDSDQATLPMRAGVVMAESIGWGSLTGEDLVADAASSDQVSTPVVTGRGLTESSTVSRRSSASSAFRAAVSRSPRTTVTPRTDKPLFSPRPRSTKPDPVRLAELSSEEVIPSRVTPSTSPSFISSASEPTPAESAPEPLTFDVIEPESADSAVTAEVMTAEILSHEPMAEAKDEPATVESAEEPVVEAIDLDADDHFFHRDDPVVDTLAEADDASAEVVDDPEAVDHELPQADVLDLSDLMVEQPGAVFGDDDVESSSPLSAFSPEEPADLDLTVADHEIFDSGEADIPAFDLGGSAFSAFTGDLGEVVAESPSDEAEDGADLSVIVPVDDEIADAQDDDEKEPAEAVEASLSEDLDPITTPVFVDSPSPWSTTPFSPESASAPLESSAEAVSFSEPILEQTDLEEDDLVDFDPDLSSPITFDPITPRPAPISGPSIVAPAAGAAFAATSALPETSAPSLGDLVSWGGSDDAPAVAPVPSVTMPIDDEPHAPLWDPSPVQTLHDDPAPLAEPDDTISADLRDHALDEMPTLSGADRAKELKSPLVLAVACPEGHTNAPGAEYCRLCHAQIHKQLPFEVRRPSLGVLRLSSGGTITLDRGVVFGRNPHFVRDGSGMHPNLVRISDPNKDISSQHCEISLDGWDVVVQDLGSTNGTEVMFPDQPLTFLQPGEPVIITPGTTVILAQAFDFVYEIAG
jgi:hypothetical protein